MKSDPNPILPTEPPPPPPPTISAPPIPSSRRRAVLLGAAILCMGLAVLVAYAVHWIL